MEGIGDRLKVRAAELGLSGAEVARRAGLTATRYGHYLQDIREPDLATLVRICRVLGLRPDVLLAYDQADPASDALMTKRAAVTAYLDVLDAGSLYQPPFALTVSASVAKGAPQAKERSERRAVGIRPRLACHAGHRRDHRP